jgi:hypothetical protein
MNASRRFRRTVPFLALATVFAGAPVSEGMTPGIRGLAVIFLVIAIVRLVRVRDNAGARTRQ